MHAIVQPPLPELLDGPVAQGVVDQGELLYGFEGLQELQGAHRALNVRHFQGQECVQRRIAPDYLLQDVGQLRGLVVDDTVRKFCHFVHKGRKTNQ